MKPKVFIAKKIPEEVERYIGEHCEYRMWSNEEPIPYEELLKEVSEVDGLLTPKGMITEEFLKLNPKLKIVSNIAVGYDTFDTAAMKRHGVIGTHTPYVLDDSVADLVFGLILSTARRITEFDKFVKEGHWNGNLDSDQFFGKDVHNSTLGIVGMGRIGEKIVKRAKLGFDMNVLYHNRSRKPQMEQDYGVSYRDLESLLKESDFVVLMLPLTSKTNGYMGANQFSMMKSDAIFINCSRGQVVNEDALKDALEQDKIRGAGLDVFETEPIDKNNSLLKMKNVITLPHIGSATAKTRFDMAMMAAENLVAGLSGETPPNVVEELKNIK